LDAALLGTALAIVAFFTTSWFFYTRSRHLALVALKDSPLNRDTVLPPSLYFVGAIASMFIVSRLTVYLSGSRALPLVEAMQDVVPGDLQGLALASAPYGALALLAALHLTNWSRRHGKPLKLRQSLRVALYVIGGFFVLVAYTLPITALAFFQPSHLAFRIAAGILIAYSHFRFHPAAYRIWSKAGGFRGPAGYTSYWLTFLSWTLVGVAMLEFHRGSNGPAQ
jgi:hypothetical protein